MSNEPTVTGYAEFHWEKRGTVWICKETGEVRTDPDMDKMKSKLIHWGPEPCSAVHTGAPCNTKTTLLP